MSKNTRWLALILVGACGTAASAQAPPMAGMPYYPQYPYAQPMPQQLPQYPMQQYPQLQYPQARGYASPAYYPQSQPQPQPRVMYISATQEDWTGAVKPASSSAKSAPAGPSGSATVVVSGSTAPVAPSEASAEARNDARTRTQLASLRKDLQCEEAGPTGCGKDAATCRIAEPPSQPLHRHRHDAEVDDCTNWLPKGHCTLQFIGGAYADLTSAKYNWGQGAVRFGHVCCSEFLSSCPGAFEFLVEANGAANYSSDYGNHFYGGGLIVRYNWVKPGSRLVPYTQLGVGAQFNDTSRDNAVQAYLGSPVELTAQAQVGFRVFLCKSLTLDFEGGVQRFGNINMSSRDDGITALGGGIGLTYFLPHHAH